MSCRIVPISLLVILVVDSTAFFGTIFCHGIGPKAAETLSGSRRRRGGTAVNTSHAFAAGCGVVCLAVHIAFVILLVVVVAVVIALLLLVDAVLQCS